MSRRRVFVDLETYSEVDLRKAGAARYAEHPSTRILMASWAEFGDLNNLQTWDESQGEDKRESLVAVLNDPAITVSGWNVKFEWALIQGCWGISIPFDRLFCDMVAAMSLSLPASLALCGEALGFPAEQLKGKDGQRLIQKFSKPRKPSKHKPWTRNTHETDPEDWAKFVDYNRQDVVAEAMIFNRIKRWVEE